MFTETESRPYTMEEINARIDQTEWESAAGLGVDTEEMLRELDKNDEQLKPYTIEELHTRIAISEWQIANGKWKDFDEAMDEIERELDKEPAMAEVV